MRFGATETDRHVTLKHVISKTSFKIGKHSGGFSVSEILKKILLIVII